MSRAASRTVRSAYRWRTRTSSDSSVCRFGIGRRALDASCQADASTDSSPRFEAITRPVTLTKSPRSTSAFHAASRSSPTSASDNIAWSRTPESFSERPSCRVAKQSLPVLRMKTTRPVTDTTASVSSPAVQLAPGVPHVAQAVGAWHRDGIGLVDCASNRSRFSRRTRICSGRSSVITRVVWSGTGSA